MVDAVLAASTESTIEGLLVGCEHRLLVGTVAQDLADVRINRCGHPNVALRRLREEPAVLEDLVEQLGGLALAAELDGHGCDRRLEALGQPAIGDDRLGGCGAAARG